MFESYVMEKKAEGNFFFIWEVLSCSLCGEKEKSSVKDVQFYGFSSCFVIVLYVVSLEYSILTVLY